jgi:hypothetical protein
MIPLFGEPEADGKRDVLEGRLISVALSHGWPVDAVLYRTGPLSDWAGQVLRDAGAVPRYELVPELMAELEKGRSAGWAGLCDTLVRIPMTGSASSLNAAVAGSLALYEARRQRGRAELSG